MDLKEYRQQTRRLTKSDKMQVYLSAALRLPLGLSGFCLLEENVLLLPPLQRERTDVMRCYVVLAFALQARNGQRHVQSC